jgi:predicted alpha/beta superfamily hydrolase
MKNYLFVFLYIINTWFSRAQDVSLRVEVHLSDIIDSTETIFITGSDSAVGNWNPGRIPLTRINDLLWKFEGSFQKGTRLQFKITRGSWEKEALYDSATIPSNFEITLQHDTTMNLKPLTWSDKIKRAKPELSIRGEVVYHRRVKGKGLKYSRDLIVWLPPSYRSAVSKKYPVLYLHDGQNIFDPSTSFSGKDWRVDETADSLIKAKAMEEIIVVGIYNTPDRLQEYSDTPLGRSYMNFVVHVVKPLIDSVYRTKPSRRNTAVMGSSLGGLVSMVMAWNYPDVFGKAACLSPSFWYDDEKTLNEIRAYSGKKKEIKIYLDCGTREKELLDGYTQMVTILKKKGFAEGKDLDSHIEEKGAHNESYWSQRVWKPLLFLFGKR